MKCIDVSTLLESDKRLICRGLAVTEKERTWSGESLYCWQHAHEGEIESWSELDLSSIDRCCNTIRPSNLLVLEPSGLAAFLPTLLGICFVSKDGALQWRLIDHVRRAEFNIMCDNRALTEMTCTLSRRLLAISLSTDQSILGHYPAGITMQGEFVENYREFLLELEVSLRP